MDCVDWVNLYARETKKASDEDDAIARGSRVFDAFESSKHAIANTGINQLMEQGEILLQEYIILKQTLAIQQQERQKEREEWKLERETLFQKYIILKQTVAIQQQHHQKEHEKGKLERETLLQKYIILKQLVTQYQLGLRTLKKKNVILARKYLNMKNFAMHLHQNQKSNSIPRSFPQSLHPDVFD